MPTLEEILAQGPSSSSGAGSPLGVPSDYEVTVPAPPPYARDAVVTATPNFFQGDEWRPASRPPEAIARVQRELANAGLLNGTYRIGTWDERTRNAYADLLGYANAIGESDDARALQRYQASGLAQQQPEEQAPERAPLVTRQSNPEDLRETFRQVAVRKMGGTDGIDLDRMVAAYQAGESGTQQRAYDMAETGGTITDVPSEEVFADRDLRKQDPVRYDSRKVVEKFESLSQMLGGA